MRRIAMVVIALAVVACGGSSDATAPGASIAGSYALFSVNGVRLPAPAALSIGESDTVKAGSLVITNARTLTLQLITTNPPGSSGTTLSTSSSARSRRVATGTSTHSTSLTERV